MSVRAQDSRVSQMPCSVSVETLLPLTHAATKERLWPLVEKQSECTYFNKGLNKSAKWGVNVNVDVSVVVLSPH